MKQTVVMFVLVKFIVLKAMKSKERCVVRFVLLVIELVVVLILIAIITLVLSVVFLSVAIRLLSDQHWNAYCIQEVIRHNRKYLREEIHNSLIS